MDDRDGDGGGEYDECEYVPICTKGVSSLDKIMLAMMLTMAFWTMMIYYIMISVESKLKVNPPVTKMIFLAGLLATYFSQLNVEPQVQQWTW